VSEVLKDRIALITGASRGIGRAVAIRFAAEGAHVILAARTQGGLEEVDDIVRATGGSATIVPLDLTDHDSIDRLGGLVAERWGRLDILVGNAARLGQLSPMAHYDPKKWAEVIDLNLTSQWRLVRAFDPLLRQSDAGRAIFVTSGVAQNIRAYWGPYAISKAALENMVRTWAAELRKTKVRVNAINPGGTRTNMRAEAFPGEDPETLPTAEDVADRFLELATPNCPYNGEVLGP
jgi:NAD(P)-dependent dehydrogenase (short-subunit alcohol dehydrogenase family)